MAKINGEEVNANNLLITEFLSQNGYSPERVAVMINGEILPKAEYAKTRISDKDEIEVVGFVGGG